MSLYGVTVRWSLHAARNEVAQELRAYVAEMVAAGPARKSEALQTLWTLREGASFGITHIFRSEPARAECVRRIRAQGSPVNLILGHSADAIEEFDVVAIAAGGAERRQRG